MSSALLSTRSFHFSAAGRPTSGTSDSHAGGRGKRAAADAASGKSRRRPALVAIELMASESGSSTRNSRSSVIRVTAAQRRPPKADCNRLMRGHVAITNVAAHTVAARKGRRTRKETTIRPTIDRTASVVRVRSNGFVTIRHSNAGTPGAAEQRGTIQSSRPNTQSENVVFNPISIPSVADGRAPMPLQRRLAIVARPPTAKSDRSSRPATPARFTLSVVRRRSRYSLYCLYRQCRDQACKQDTGKSDYDGEKPGQSLSW